MFSATWSKEDEEATVSHLTMVRPCSRLKPVSCSFLAPRGVASHAYPWGRSKYICQGSNAG